MRNALAVRAAAGRPWRLRAALVRGALVRPLAGLALTGFVAVTQGAWPSATTQAAATAGTRHGSDRARKAQIRRSLTLSVAPNPTVFGSPFLVQGKLSGVILTNRERRYEIVVQANPFPYADGFRPLGEPELTNGAGEFSFPVNGLLDNAEVRVVTGGKPVLSSPVALESVAVRVSFHARATRRQGFVRLYGTVAPPEVGALVGFQLLEPGGGSVNEGGTVVKAGTSLFSSFSRVVRGHRGLYQALVKVSDGAHASNYSAPVLIR